MSASQVDDNQRVVSVVLVVVILLVISLAVGVGISRSHKKPADAKAPVAAAVHAPEGAEHAAEATHDEKKPAH